jgi:hypothetical protein
LFEVLLEHKAQYASLLHMYKLTETKIGLLRALDFTPSCLLYC